jgi:hypothetical protein
MRNLILALILLLAINSCSIFDPPQNPAPTFTYGPDITTSELNFFVYQVGDTFNFINSKGEVLHFVCISRDHYKDKYDPTVKCSYQSACTFPVNDHLNIGIKCITDSRYNFLIHYEGGGYLTISMDCIFDQFSLKLKTPTYPCLLAYEDSVNCVDSVLINNKMYNNLSIIYGADGGTNLAYNPHYNDSLFYSQQYGLIKFCFADDRIGYLPEPYEIWVKQ